MSYIEPSSFRDPTSRVFIDDQRVLRGFSSSGAEMFRQAHESGVLSRLADKGRLVPYRDIPAELVPFVHPSVEVIESDRLSFVSQPPEWSFTMLKDAALLTLEINIELIDQGFLLKDASAFNVTFDGSRPVFLDHGSFTTIGDKGIWSAYGQFVDHFLSPLFLEAYMGIPFQPRLRGTVVGIPVKEMNALLRGKARRRRGVTTHVAIRSRLERGSAGYGADSRARVAEMQLPRSSIKRTLEKTRNLVEGLASPVAGTWSDYSDAPPYEADEYHRKLEFVSDAARRVSGGTLIDIGANSGDFSCAASDQFSLVLAIDSDSGAVDRLYQRVRGDVASAVTPLVIDLMEPTSSTGWVNTERAAFLDRAHGKLGLWLAVLHHLTISGGIPLSHSLDLAARLTEFAVIEFVMPNDPMVQLIGATASPDGARYDLSTFEAELERRFRVIEFANVRPTRRLYFARSKMG